MPKKPASPVPGSYGNHTVAMRHGRKAFALSVVEEVRAWLVMVATRHAKAIELTRGAGPAMPDRWSKGMLKHHTERLSGIMELIDLLPHKWDSAEWRDACNLAARVASGEVEL